MKSHGQGPGYRHRDREIAARNRRAERLEERLERRPTRYRIVFDEVHVGVPLLESLRARGLTTSRRYSPTPLSFALTFTAAGLEEAQTIAVACMAETDPTGDLGPWHVELAGRVH